MDPSVLFMPQGARSLPSGSIYSNQWFSDPLQDSPPQPPNPKQNQNKPETWEYLFKCRFLDFSPDNPSQEAENGTQDLYFHITWEILTQVVPKAHMEDCWSRQSQCHNRAEPDLDRGTSVAAWQQLRQSIFSRLGHK